ncbi:unnamed protein product [Urochloa humidicola]
MEEIKLAAAHYVCSRSGRTAAEVYEKVLAVTGDARRCYDADDPSVAGLSDADFAAMMFLDGCFLLQIIAVSDSSYSDSLLDTIMQSTGSIILKDIFLLENQIPWLVLQRLSSSSCPSTCAGSFSRWESSFPGRKREAGECNGGCIPVRRADDDNFISRFVENVRPPHLLASG